MNTFITLFKILTLISLTFVFYHLNSYEQILSLISIMMIFLFFSQPKRLFNRIKSLLILGLLIFLFQLLVNRFNLNSFALKSSFLAIIKIIGISMSILMFTSVTSPLEIINAFWFLPSSIKLVITLTANFIPIIIKEFEYIKLVQKSRGLNHSLISFISLIIPLFHRLFKRAQIITLSITSRGYE